MWGVNLSCAHIFSVSMQLVLVIFIINRLMLLLLLIAFWQNTRNGADVKGKLHFQASCYEALAILSLVAYALL